MKKIYNQFLFIMIALLGINTLATGQAPITWTAPAAFYPDEELTIYFDVTGTPLANEAGPLYLWTWVPSDPANGNGEWANSPDHMMCEAVTDADGNTIPNQWKFVMGAPTEFYGQEVTAISEINGLLKLQDGSLQTDNFEGETAIRVFDFSSLESKTGAVWPETFTANTPISIMVNVNVAEADGKPKVSNDGPVQMHSGAIIEGTPWTNAVEYNGVPNDGKQDTKLTKILYTESSSIWKIDLIPSDYYALSEGQATTFGGVSAVFNGGNWDTEAKDDGEDFLFEPKSEDEEEVSGIRSFPAKITENDLLTIYFDAKEEVGGVTPLLLENTVFVKFILNGTVESKIEMTPSFDNTHELSIIPSITFSEVLSGASVSSLEYVFTNEAEDAEVAKEEDEDEFINYSIEIVD